MASCFDGIVIDAINAIKSSLAEWRDVVRRSGIKPE
jgi:hypothetical protein